MKKIGNWVCPAVVCISAIIPGAASAQLSISEVCTVATTACVSPSNKPELRRGTTETIKIRGPFVDHTSLSEVTSGNPGVKILSVTGYPCGSVGCLDVKISVINDFNLASRLVPIFVKNLFGATAFNAFIVRKGEITQMTQTPDPAVWGQAVSVTVSGNDIGNTRMAVSQSGVFNEVEAPSGPGFGTARFTVVAGNSPPQTTTSITLGDDAVSGIPGNYRFTIPRRTVNYRPATEVASCATTLNISAPSLVSPQNGQVFTFTNNPVQAAITLRWGGANGQFKPNEKYIVEYGQSGQPMTSTTTAEGVLQLNLTLNRNRTYQWRARAWNCGMPGPFSPFSSFTVQ